MNNSIQRLLPSLTDILSAGALAMAGAVVADRKIGDPTLDAVVLSAAQPFFVRLVEWICDNKTTDEFRTERDREFLDEVHRQIAAVTELATSAMNEAQRTSQHAVTVQEAVILIDQYRDHAARSVLDERRKLLAAAAAATFRPDIAVEMKARGERALAILEPSDISALRGLVKQIAQARSMEEKKTIYDEHPLINRLALEQSGCIMVQSHLESGGGGGGGDSFGFEERLKSKLYLTPQVTPLGEAVLTLLETYRPSSAEIDSQGQ